MSKPFFNIIFCIFACDTIEKYKKEIFKIKETWGNSQEAPHYKILFFLGEEGPLVGEDFVHLENVENDYLSASYKQYGGLKYIYENYNFNYVFICGTDTYVLVDNLIDYINENPEIHPETPIVIGGHGDNRQICNDSLHFFSGGGGILLTRAAVNIIYPDLHTMQEEWMWLCVENNYNTYIAACDLSLCYFLKKKGILFLNVVSRFFNCNYLGRYQDFSACCEKNVNLKTMISCHHMTLTNFDNLYCIKKTQTCKDLF
jgi:hypothetical protein